MQHFFHSAFLQALGYAIAHSLWQFALVWIIVVLANSLVRLSARYRYALAVSAQVAGFTWFLLTFGFYYRQCADAASEGVLLSNVRNNFVQAEGSNLPSGFVGFMIKAEQLLPYLSFAYLLLLLFLGFRWCRFFSAARHIKASGINKIDVEWRLFVQETAVQMGIREKVQIYLSEVVKSPLTLGFLKPVILIPLAGMNSLTTQQMEAVILHELAHIRRMDYLCNLLLSLVEMVLFFNPFTELISRQVRKEREHCCDDWVLQYQYQAADYVEALLKIATLQAQPVLAMHAADKGELLTRVRRMVMKHETRFNYKQQLFAFLLMAGILSGIAWMQPVKPAPAGNHPANTQVVNTVVVEPLAMKVDNPLFNPLFFLKEDKQITETTEEQVVLEEAKREAEEVLADEVTEPGTPQAIRVAQVALKNVTPVVMNELKNIRYVPAVAFTTPAVNEGLRQADIALKQLNFQFSSDSVAQGRSLSAGERELRIIQEGLRKAYADIKAVNLEKLVINLQQQAVKQKSLADIARENAELFRVNAETFKQNMQTEKRNEETFRVNAETFARNMQTEKRNEETLRKNEKQQRSAVTVAASATARAGNTKKRIVIELVENGTISIGTSPSAGSANGVAPAGFTIQYDGDVETDSLYTDPTGEEVSVKVTKRISTIKKTRKTARL
jgi:beta-lactamase regulating signal transducer with metallopeptidase domain